MDVANASPTVAARRRSRKYFIGAMIEWRRLEGRGRGVWRAPWVSVGRWLCLRTARAKM